MKDPIKERNRVHFRKLLPDGWSRISHEDSGPLKEMNIYGYHIV